jgi:hypothetical protein
MNPTVTLIAGAAAVPLAARALLYVRENFGRAGDGGAASTAAGARGGASSRAGMLGGRFFGSLDELFGGPAPILADPIDYIPGGSQFVVENPVVEEPPLIADPYSGESSSYEAPAPSLSPIVAAVYTSETYTPPAATASQPEQVPTIADYFDATWGFRPPTFDPAPAPAASAPAQPEPQQVPTTADYFGGTVLSGSRFRR